ncbi:hypothetical protein QR680_009485 [Steinernema hermaphroditum]|uniref:RNA cytidine acetyltransferase n=1 Tax=Steinernema hermaphroditum TaxID=289476 RepID=A0AA39IMW9_9BILA|nr:hypothetical protein QR680_009485 [Steinernema hermaphroditum]
MVRTKLDNRIRTLIENGVAAGHRSMFAVVGDKGRDQIVILHHILSKAVVAARPSILWCYKKDLGFSSHRKKRMKEVQKKLALGKINVREDDPFELFVSSTEIRYCYYSESHKILGNTYGMLVLQDFEAITPNLLARTIETVEGGGIVVFLLRSVNSLRQLYAMTMDVHSRYRTEAHTEIVARFNERFILSLASCKMCAVIDDQLNVLPISSHIKKIEAVPPSEKKKLSKEEEVLRELKAAMADSKPIGQLLAKCRTNCQGKVLLQLLDVITEKTLKATCSITAARGRGKSAALGLAIAGAVGFGYTSIFVTSPSPENLKTLFEFIVKGFEAMDYLEHTDYELIQSTDPEFNKATVRINITREHRQTIQYIHPSEAGKLGQAELVVVDEAAAIPLPLVKELISGPYLVFLASTINGYEGTGRSLSLKLLQQLREQSSGAAKKNEKGQQQIATANVRTLHELSLEESIRYKPGDHIEQWLNRVLCLDATNIHRLISGTPPPKDCELYYVNRDTLFSFHKGSEQFLRNMMSIYASAHYKNTPNDLQLLSDAPAHHLFVLMGPVRDEQTHLPEILAVVQICLEGSLAKSSVSSNLERGRRAAGDLLPWTISQQFLDSDFPTLSGARVVRIAVHPDYQSMGYGSRALELLIQYYSGEISSLSETPVVPSTSKIRNVEDDKIGLLEEQVAPRPREDLPPLLHRLTEHPAERLDYIGTSFGLTLNLLKFWKRASFVPVYLRQTTNELTGEYTCIMLRSLASDDDDECLPSESRWLASYWKEFRTRLISLLGFEFSKFSPHLAISLMQLKNPQVEKQLVRQVYNREELEMFLSNTDLKRMAQYARNMIDHHLVTDLLPVVSKLYFNDKVSEEVRINIVQSAILLGLGLQHKTVDHLVKELEMPANQILALFSKTMRRLSDYFDSLCMNALERQIGRKKEKVADTPVGNGVEMEAMPISLEEDLRDAEEDIKRRQKRDRAKLEAELGKSFKEYAIKGTDEQWANALSTVKLDHAKSTIVTVQSHSTPSKSTDYEAQSPSTKKNLKRKRKSGGKK